MAELEVEGGDLVLRLSAAEKVEAAHGDLRVPVSAVKRVEVLEDAHRPADLVGLKVGTRIPGLVEVATVHGVNKTILAAVHHGTPRGVRVLFEGTGYDEWVVGCRDPEAVVAALALPSEP
ncbi:MAG: hypothetical protein ACP5VR_00650 [Acidimicrobiales bacterium]